MEYVDGPNLLDVVKKFGPLDMGRAVSYIRQVALGLDYAFRNGIIHRDIKPGNILIDRRGMAKILDMGLARFFNDQTDKLTMKYDDKIVLGTADYVAPEQVANSHAVDIRADIYGLGATFYFLLAGHPPFPNGTVSQKLLWHRTKEPTPDPADPPGRAGRLGGGRRADDGEGPEGPVPDLRRSGPGTGSVAAGTVMLPADEEMPALSPAATLATDENFNSDSGAMAMQHTPAQGMLVGASGGGGSGAAAAIRSGTTGKVIRPSSTSANRPPRANCRTPSACRRSGRAARLQSGRPRPVVARHRGQQRRTDAESVRRHLLEALRRRG